MKFSPVMDTYWRFACERQLVYSRRLHNPVGPWTDDPILLRYRFTNAYRASDRVSQYLIRHVQYDAHRSQHPQELFFRTLLFKLFNKIETWERLEEVVGPLSWQATNLDDVVATLDDMMEAGQTVYSAAYIMPAPALGHARKHANHVMLLRRMMDDNLPQKVSRARSLQHVYELLLAYPGLGRFLAFQYAIDLNYSALLDFEESSFVVAGPGALDGISKCIETDDGLSAEEIIFQIAEGQDAAFDRLGLAFPRLGARRLQPIDCQNLFCEISKYARVAHPEVQGISKRTRIKQMYRPQRSPVEKPFFPPRWGMQL